MDSLTILLIALGLAMDAFAVSVAKGITLTHERRKTAVTIAVFFGGFQMLMPVIGWLAGIGLRDLIMGIDHWIAFGFLCFIGSKMIYDSSKRESEKQGKLLSFRSLLVLSVATSIDALMIGLSFAFLQIYIALPVLIIGVVTFTLSLVGFIFGNTVGKFFGNKIKIVGGLILIVIGVRILIEHLL